MPPLSIVGSSDATFGTTLSCSSYVKRPLNNDFVSVVSVLMLLRCGSIVFGSPTRRRRRTCWSGGAGLLTALLVLLSLPLQATASKKPARPTPRPRKRRRLKGWLSISDSLLRR